jgi:hypothetical protein
MMRGGRDGRESGVPEMVLAMKRIVLVLNEVVLVLVIEKGQR